jgi:hypothetical protein
MFVIHVGPRKTATTYLQSNFYRNREQLLARGWLYPIVAQRTQNAHHQVASSKDEVLAGEGALFKRLKRASDDALKKDANLLISSEGLRKWTARDFVKLGKVLGQTDVMIAYTLRDPFTLLASIWGESVKNGRTRSFPDYAARQINDRSKSQALNPLGELGPILDHPKLRLAVLDYEAVRTANQDIYTAFCRDILGIDGMLPSLDKPKNFSLPIELTDYLRALAERTGYEPKKSDLLFSRLFTACHKPEDLDRIVTAMKSAGPAFREAVTLDRGADWYAALDAELLARIGPFTRPVPSGDRLFGREAVEMKTYDMTRLAVEPEIGKLLEDSANRMKAGRVPWSRSPIMRTWRYIQRTLGF